MKEIWLLRTALGVFCFFGYIGYGYDQSAEKAQLEALKAEVHSLKAAIQVATSQLATDNAAMVKATVLIRKQQLELSTIFSIAKSCANEQQNMLSAQWDYAYRRQERERGNPNDERDRQPK